MTRTQNRPFILTAQERLALRKQVNDILQRGRFNAITGKDMAQRFGHRDDRKIRVVIRELIKEGVPIASSVSDPMGYYIVSNEYEAADYIKGLKGRIQEDTERLQEFINACSEFPIPEQVSLFESKGGK